MVLRILIAAFLVQLLCPSQDLFAQIKWDLNRGYKKDTVFKEMERAIENNKYGKVHSIIIIKDHKNIYEEYFNGWERDSLHQLQSATKSIVSTLLGIAIQENYVNSVQELISEYYKNEFKSVNEKNKKKISIEDLLTQRHGFNWKESPWDSPDNNWRNVLESEGNWYKMILQTPMDTIPGSKFNYSNAAPVLITGLIQKASNKPINEFAKDFLFEPLSISKVKYWDGNGGPQNNGLALLYLRSRDIAKIGQLYLQNGQWNNVQVLPKDYINQATSSRVINAESNEIYKSYNYGYFWWVDPEIRAGYKKNSSDNIEIYLARGAGGQNLIVWPSEKIVMVITAWNLKQPNILQRIFDDYVVPLFSR